MKTRRTAVCCVPLILAICSIAAAARSALQSGQGMHSATPAGYDVVVLKPSGITIALMGLIECPELEGAQHIAAGSNAKLLSADGETMKTFPNHFSFRITATLQKVSHQDAADTLQFRGDPRDLLLKLRFRVKAYSGLRMREIIPESIDLIGMPADVPYNERVYRVTIKNTKMAITDRVVIEILSPQGETMTHFPFNLL
ncbi:MAG: hypothetical protein WA738_02960 [Candidatus Angelobacter sp.]